MQPLFTSNDRAAFWHRLHTTTGQLDPHDVRLNGSPAQRARLEALPPLERLKAKNDEADRLTIHQVLDILERDLDGAQRYHDEASANGDYYENR